MGRTVSLQELIAIRKQLKKEGKKVVFTNGCFDLIHRGHVEYLKQSKERADVLVVGLNTDDSVRRLKGKGRPILPLEDRASVLAALEVVDYVSVFGEDTPLQMIKKILPDILVKGGDYTADQIVGKEVVEESGGQVLTVDLIAALSTTDIIQKTKGKI